MAKQAWRGALGFIDHDNVKCILGWLAGFLLFLIKDGIRNGYFRQDISEILL